MTKPQLLIDQPAGIGDILWIQKITKVLSEKYEVFHPVKDSISWMVDYMPNLCTIKEVPFPCDKVLKLDGIDALYPGKRIMETKYLCVNIDWKDYLEYINIKRNKEKEEELFSLVSSGKPYRLVCPYYGTPETKTSSGALKMDIPLSTSLDNIEMRNIEGYTLFDWLKVIQKAEEIYTTDSAIMFLIELYSCKATELVCYTRRHSSKEIEYMFNKKWSYPEWI